MWHRRVPWRLIAALRLTHFRSHENLTLDARARHGAVGRNGIGKTNVLEALSMLAPGRGLRGAVFDDMRFERRLGWTVSSRYCDAGRGARRYWLARRGASCAH